MACVVVLTTISAAAGQEDAPDGASAPGAPSPAAAPEEQPAASSEESPDAAAPSADEAAIRKNAEAYVMAYNARDAKALAALWSPDAVYADPDSGAAITGRAAIEEYFTSALSGDVVDKLEVEVAAVEFVSPSVAIEHGVARVLRPNEEPEVTEYSAVNVKQGGEWLLDRVSEKSSPEPPRSNYQRLQKLEWMVGSWIDEDESVSIQTDCEWTKNRNFLTRSFAVVSAAGVETAGTQIIGWDPAAKRIRSWLFDSNGGFGEGVWTEKEGVWSIQSTITLPDGAKATAVNLMKPIDNDSFTWQSVNRAIDGQLQPNVSEVLVVRAADELASEP
jgi:uncharacterized protein (TIGR02246 family)